MDQMTTVMSMLLITLAVLMISINLMMEMLINLICSTLMIGLIHLCFLSSVC